MCCKSSSGPCGVMSSVPHRSCATLLDAETGMAGETLSLASAPDRAAWIDNKPVSVLTWGTGVAPVAWRAFPFQPHLVARPISNVISSIDRVHPPSPKGQ